MVEARLNRKLNIVLPLDAADGGKVYVHSQPLSRAAFEQNFLVISRAYTAIYTNGLGPITGPRVSMLLLRQQAAELDIADVVERSLVQEIYRLTSVVFAGPNGWETLPWQVARSRALLDDEEAAAAENALVYFICASAIAMKAELSMATTGLRQLWGASTTLSTVTEFMNSLPTLTPAANTGANAPAPEMAVQPLAKASSTPA